MSIKELIFEKEKWIPENDSLLNWLGKRVETVGNPDGMTWKASDGGVSYQRGIDPSFPSGVRGTVKHLLAYNAGDPMFEVALDNYGTYWIEKGSLKLVSGGGKAPL